MSNPTEDEIKLLEKKLELLRQIHDLEKQVSQGSIQVPPTQELPPEDKLTLKEVNDELAKLTPEERFKLGWKLFYKNKNAKGPIHGKETEETVVSE